MIEFNELLETLQAEALADKFEPTQTSVWENICRQYSKKFFTPLHAVLKMDPEFVIRQIYADQMDEANFDDHLENLVDLLKHLEDPEYDADAEKEMDEFIAKAEAEEKERIAKGLPLKSVFRKGHQPAAKKPELPKPIEPELPKSGSANLGNLSEDENER